jgi:hypothetical protein
MKILPTILFGACALALVSSASADTVLRLTGSTAFRAQTHKAIINILNGGPVQAAFERVSNGTISGTATSLSGSDRAVFIGTISGRGDLGTVTVKTSWSGSTGGIQTVSNSLAIGFMPDVPSSTAAATVTAGAATGGVQVTDAGINEIPLAGMADTFQGSTPFTANPLTYQTVGVIGFQWVASKGSPAGLDNITPQLAQALWGNGTLPLALFTGDPADQGALVYATGRDPDSGTRATAFAEAGVGVFSVVTQYKPSITSGAVTSWAPYPQQTVNGITFPVGQGGEASGSSLIANVTASGSAAVGYGIAYMSVNDAVTAVNGGAKALNYNGIPYSLQAVREGKYTFWCYQHVTYRNTLTGGPKDVADLMANQILNTDSPILLNSMNCSRPTDGGQITPNY